MKIPVPYSKPFIAAFLSLIVLLAFASCGDSESATEEPTATLTSFDLTFEAGSVQYETCYEPTETLRVDVAQKLKAPDEGLRSFYLIRHSYATNRWTLGVDLEGPGFEGDGPILLFSVIGLRAEDIGIDNIQPLNEIAIEHIDMASGFADVPEGTIEFALEKRKTSLEILNACISQRLSRDPEIPVY